MIEVEWAEFSEVGPRETNQDRTLKPVSSAGNYCILGIADGIGGAPGGAEAATIAVDVASRAEPDPHRLPVLFDEVVGQLAKEAEVTPEFGRMGTTLSLALLKEGNAYVAHVGDTRIYHLRGQGLITLTEDQTEAAALLRKGVLKPRQLKRYPRRNVLLSALTPNGGFELHSASAQIAVGDRILLLSDGVYEKITRRSVVEASLANKEIHAFVAELERLVAEAGPSDNYSALGVQITTLG